MRLTVVGRDDVHAGSVLVGGVKKFGNLVLGKAS